MASRLPLLRGPCLSCQTYPVKSRNGYKLPPNYNSLSHPKPLANIMKSHFKHQSTYMDVEKM